MATAIVNGKVYTPGKVIENGTVLFEQGRITAVGTGADVVLPPQVETIDAAGRPVIPGLVDVHIHGLLGYDSMGAQLADVIPALPAYGVTSFMATTLTLPRGEVIECLHEMAEVLAAPPSGARCLGIHIEGPHLAPSKPGMATADWVYPLTWEDFQTFQEAAGGHIRMITFAPETGRAMDVIPQLVAAGVVPVIGHTDATFAQVARAVELGANHATHTYNAMRPLGHREPGVVGAVMFYDQIYGELIADGIHIHPAAMAILLKVKGLEKVVLVSDAAPIAGLPDGQYEWEHKPIFIREGRCQLSDGTLAGAHALLDTGVRNLVHKVGLPLEQALVPATASAAASVKATGKGQLAPGFDADIVLLDEDLKPVMTFVEGQKVWER